MLVARSKRLQACGLAMRVRGKLQEVLEELVELGSTRGANQKLGGVLRSKAILDMLVWMARGPVVEHEHDKSMQQLGHVLVYIASKWAENDHVRKRACVPFKISRPLHIAHSMQIACQIRNESKLTAR